MLFGREVITFNYVFYISVELSWHSTLLTVQEIQEHAGYWGDPVCDTVFIIDNSLHIIADNLATKFVCFPLAFIFKIQRESLILF